MQKKSANTTYLKSCALGKFLWCHEEMFELKQSFSVHDHGILIDEQTMILPQYPWSYYYGSGHDNDMHIDDMITN